MRIGELVINIDQMKKACKVLRKAGIKSLLRRALGSINGYKQFVFRHEPLISILAVNYNGGKDLPDFLNSLSRQSYTKYELVIVDNNSTDNSLEILASYNSVFKRYKIVNSRENLGFAEGNNLAYRNAAGELVALLNIDIKVHEDCLLELVNCLRISPNSVIAVAPKVLFWERFNDLTFIGDNDFVVELAGLLKGISYKKYFIREGEVGDSSINSRKRRIVISIPETHTKYEIVIRSASANVVKLFIGCKSYTEVTKYVFPAVGEIRDLVDTRELEISKGWVVNNAGSIESNGMPGDRGIGEYDDEEYNHRRYIDFFCGVAVLIRRSGLIGRDLFVPEFFAYYEDSELSRWLRGRGYKIIYNPMAIVYHRHSSTAIERSYLWNYLVERSRCIYLSRNSEKLHSSLKTLAIKYDEISDKLKSTLSGFDHSVVERVREFNTIIKKDFSIGIYNTFWNSRGGGESHALSIASVLRKYGKVYLIGDSDFSIEEMDKYFGIDLIGCVKVVQEKIDTKLTEQFDIFINSTYGSNLNSHAKKSYYVVSFPHKKISRQVLKSYYFLYNSEFTREWAMKYWGKHSGKVLYPIGMLKLDKDIQVNVKIKAIISVGRFSPSGHCKNHLQIAKAYKKIVLRDQEYSEWTLILIGSVNIDSKEDSNYVENIKEELKNTKGKVILNANRKELEESYKLSYIYVHAAGLNVSPNEPERQEHFGITPIEAMSYGCIPLVYEVGGPAETVNLLELGYKFSSEEDLEVKLKAIMNTYKSNNSETAKVQAAAREFLSANQQETNWQALLNLKNSD